MPIEEWTGELLIAAFSLSHEFDGGVVKACPNWAIKLQLLDPKLDELTLGRLSVNES